MKRSIHPGKKARLRLESTNEAAPPETKKGRIKGGLKSKNNQNKQMTKRTIGQEVMVYSQSKERHLLLGHRELLYKNAFA